MLTCCSIKYMNWSFPSKTRYMIKIGFKKLGRTIVPKLPSSYHPKALRTTPASNLGYLATPGQFFMGAKLFIGAP